MVSNFVERVLRLFGIARSVPFQIECVEAMALSTVLNVNQSSGLWRYCGCIQRRTSSSNRQHPLLAISSSSNRRGYSSRSIPCLSQWRGRKASMLSRESLIAIEMLKRVKNDPAKLLKVIQIHVVRLLKPDLMAVLFAFQAQREVSLSLKIFDLVRNEIWYKPDMCLYRDMIISLVNNKRDQEAKPIWKDMKKEKIILDQHTYGSIVHKYFENGLISEGMRIYQEMKERPDPPLEGPYRKILKSAAAYPLVRDKIGQDFQELLPGLKVDDPPDLVEERIHFPRKYKG